jgi:mRNA interferase MazF
VIAMPLTTSAQRAGPPLTWPVPAGLLPRPSWVKVSQVRTLSTERVGRPAGRLDDDQMGQIIDALLELVG